MENRAKKSISIRRIGFYGTLAAVMMMLLAACGTADNTGSTSGSSTDQAANAITQPTSTPAAGDMGGNMGAAPTPAEDAAPTAAAGDQAPAPGNSTEVQGTLREWAIDLSTHEVAAGKITFVVTNQGRMAHNFTILNDSGTVAATPNFRSTDGAQTLEVDLQPGTYTIICSLPGHAQRGQKTDLVVK